MSIPAQRLDFFRQEETNDGLTISASNESKLVILSVLLEASRTEFFRSDFQAGNFEVSSVSVGPGGTVFLAVPILCRVKPEASCERRFSVS